MQRGKGAGVRILLLSNLYPPFVQGGAEILAADVATGLERLGHEVLVLTSSSDIHGPQQDGHIWRTLRCAPPAHFDRHGPFWRQARLPYNYYRRYHNPSNAAEVRRVVEATRPNIIYVWELAGTGVTSLLDTLSKLKIPTIFHLNSYWLLYASSPDTEQSRLRTRWFKQRLIGTIPSMASASFIAISATVKQNHVRAGFDSKHIEVIYNGIDARFLELPSTKNSSNAKEYSELLFVGRLRVEKGLLVLLKALAILVDEQQEERQKGGSSLPLRLNIFGTGDEVYIRELEVFVREKNLNQVVTFCGKIPQDELIGRYDSADMLLVPSLWDEPFGLVVAEAMARELPVIASDIGGPAEIITHGVNGLLTEPGDEHALASAIRELLEQPEQRKQLGQAARETVWARFTIEENTRQVEQHMRHVVREYNSGTSSASVPLSKSL